MQSSQTLRERGAFASGNSCFISSRVQKLKNSAKQMFYQRPVPKLQKAALFGGSLSCDAELWFSGKGERTTREKFCVAFCFCLVTVFMPGWERGETVIYAPFIFRVLVRTAF